MKLYTLYDSKAASGANPFTAVNDDTAMRNLAQAVNDVRSGNLYHCPEDFVLYCLGEWSPETMEIKPHYPAAHVVNAHSLVGRIDDVQAPNDE